MHSRAGQAVKTLATTPDHRVIQHVISLIGVFTPLDFDNSSEEVRKSGDEFGKAVDVAVDWAKANGSDSDHGDQRFRGIPEDLEYRVRETAAEFCLDIFDDRVEKRLKLDRQQSGR